jgi:hypothetical protein
MPPLYKYLPLKYAKDLTEKGIIKLGTLSEYQNVDLHGTDIGDKDEGNISKWSLIDKKNVTNKDLNDVERRAFNIPDGVVGVQINNCLAVATQKSDDLFIYSTSRLFNVQLMRIINSNYHEKYDACIKIHNPDKFIQTISDAFKEHGNFEATRLCAYISRSIHHSKPDPDIHPVFIKEPRYKYQEEIRSVWSSISTDEINSRVLKIPELSEFCELYYVDELIVTDDFPKIIGKSFVNDVLKIDSTIFNKCNFKNSRIIYSAENKFYLDTCEFHGCEFIFEGAAGETIDFIKNIYHHFGDGGKEIVNPIFEYIKNK